MKARYTNVILLSVFLILTLVVSVDGAVLNEYSLQASLISCETPKVILQSGTAGTSTIYTNNTSAKVSVAASGWLSGWDKRVKITIDRNDVDGALSNFPVLVYLSNSSGKNNDDVSFVFDELQSDVNRRKIAVTTSDGITPCYIEIEKWANANEQAWLWVKVPSVSNTTDTDLYLYHDVNHANNTNYVGDPNSIVAQNVWESDFVGVWHLDETGTGTRYDSTSKNNDGTTSGYDGDEATTGKIDGGDDLDGSNDYLYRTDANLDGEIPCKSSGGATSFTISAWINIDTTPNRHIIAAKQEGSAAPQRGFNFYTSETASPMLELEIFKGDNPADRTGITSVGTLAKDTWHHVAATYRYVADGSSQVRLYINGSNDGSTDSAVGPPQANSKDLRIGRYYWSASYQRYLDGTIDEVRISNTTRSAAWIKASYESGRDDLLDYESEERNVVDYVDNNASNIGSPTDIGTHTNFSAQQYGPDSTYDTLTEEDTLGSWGNYSSELLINPGAEFGNTTGWTATGPNAANFVAGFDCPAGSAGPHTGSYAFYWNNPSSSSDWAYQEVDLSPWLSGIQLGEVQIMAKGWLVCSEYHDPPWDIVRMSVVFYDNSSQEISSDTYDTGEWGNLTAWTEFGIENYTIPTNAVTVGVWFQTFENGWDAGNADDFTVKVRTFRNYELDLEVQWTNVNYTETYEELCIKTGTIEAESINVDVWNGSTWVNIFADLTPNSWNNVSVSLYLDSSTFTIRFKGGNETGDITEDSWNIDTTLLHVFSRESTTYDYVLQSVNQVADLWKVRLRAYNQSDIGRLSNCSIYFHNSTDGISSQIYVESGFYEQDVGPWYNLTSFSTIYISIAVVTKTQGTSYIYSYLEVLFPDTSTYNLYVIAFEIA